jgi:bacteriocin-like protein
MSNEGKRSRSDHLTATTPDGRIELTEEELSSVSGGAAVAKDTTFKIKFTSTTKDKVES